MVLVTPPIPTTVQLLDTARELAGGDHSVVTLNGPRAACLITRQVLEVLIAGLLLRRDLECSHAPMRAQLICLGQAYADAPQVTTRAATVWWRLSSACHHHAYELNPTATEAMGLIDDVAWLYDWLMEKQTASVAAQKVSTA